ncbi:MAG: hypothetical protein H7A38_05655 [Chlamydiales bacterium]|nr:hypothetical protein [Chlamydiales bacterium]
MNQKIAETLKADLLALHDDWEVLLKQDALLKDGKFLRKVAADILKLDTDATLAKKESSLKEQAEVLHFALSTPWGAPFIGETTLLDAANTFREDHPETALMHLLSDFLKYGHKKKVPLFDVLEDISEELNSP